CEPHPEADPERPWTKGVVDQGEYLRWKQHLLYIGNLIVEDVRAQSFAEGALEKTPRREMDHRSWWKNVLADLNWVVRFERNPELTQPSGRPIEPGDLVLLPSKFDPRLRVALEVEPGTRGPIVSVADGKNEDGIRRFVSSFLKTVEWPSVLERSGAA